MTIKLPETKMNECVEWIIKNIKLSAKFTPQDVFSIVESAFYSGYLQRQKEYKENQTKYDEFVKLKKQNNIRQE